MKIRMYLTRLLVFLLAWILYYTGFLKILARHWGHPGPLILAYHRILDAEGGAVDFPPPGVTLRPETFCRQLGYLCKEYSVISLDELVRMIREEEELRGVAVITFDDGWRDNYVNGFPVLLRYGVTATIFLVTDYIGTTRRFWPDKLTYVLSRAPAERVSVPDSMRDWIGSDFLDLPVVPDSQLVHALVERLKGLTCEQRDSFIDYVAGRTGVSVEELETRRGMLTWDEVKEMSAEGISFGSHTQTHPIMTTIPVDEARREILDSKTHIEKHLGSECSAFAYPNGDWNDEVRGLVMMGGYDCACAVGNIRSDSEIDPYTLERIAVHEGYALGAGGEFSACVFALKTSGLLRGLLSWMRRGAKLGGECA